jgi:glycosyltransferase involved in cell wall biosynthesis
VRVALDEQIFAIQPYGGISRMFAELADQFVRGNHADIDLLPLDATIVNRYVLDSPTLTERLRVTEGYNQWTSLARYFTRMRIPRASDIVHNTFYLPHGLTPTRGAKRIVTVNDMIPELLPRTRRRLDWFTLKKRYVDSADHIICISEATKQDLIKVYGPTHAPISVVHLGVDSRFRPDVPKEDFLPNSYVLFVGHRDQYKDADVLFQAFALIARETPEIHLLCVGGNGLSPEEVHRLERLGIRSRVSQRHLSDSKMISAYCHADVFVFPSHFEGFGLTALEAMACGAPTVLAAATSLPEVGGDAAAYFEPGSATDLADVILALLADQGRRDELTRLGLARAAEFTWARTAEKTARVYREALAA